MPYSFNTVVLSAQKTGSPNLIGTLLSAFGVNTISLSTNDKGLAFNAEPTLVGRLTNHNVQGSVFRIDEIYHNKVMALIKVPSNNISTYTVFTHNSGYAVTPLSALATDTDVIDADGRRKYILGYL